jgi:protein-S-isoprenylcysteine O-methyltransferase Ste14
MSGTASTAGAKRISRAGLIRAGIDASVAAFYALFAWAHWVAFSQHPRPSLAVLVAIETLFACFILTRRSSDAASRSTWDWVATALGTLTPLLLRPVQAASDVAVGEVIQTTAALLTVAGALSLNRSFGLVPAHRGVKTAGLYRLVRHPLYMSYTLGQVGYLISNVTLWNALVVGTSFAFQLVRIANEERFLSGYAEYRAYQARTRWRVLPFLY